MRRVKAEEPDATGREVNGFAWDLLTSDFPELRDPRAALPLAERALGLVEEERTEASVLDTLALALHMNGRNDEAIERQRQALALLPEDDAGRRSEYVVPLVRYLAGAGSDREAREAIVEQVRALHATSGTTGDFVGAVDRFSKQLAEQKLHAHAELAGRTALEIARTERGNEPAAVAGLLYGLGRSLLHQGKAEEAEPVLREGLSRARQTDDESVLTYVQIHLAEALIHNGGFGDARDLAVEVVDRRNEDKAPRGGFFNREPTMEAMRLLGTARLRMGDTHGAEAPLREAERWFARNRAPDAWPRARAESAWGEYLVATRRYAEAEPLLVASHRTLEQMLGAEAAATRDANQSIVRLYEAWGKPAPATQRAGVDRP